MNAKTATDRSAYGNYRWTICALLFFATAVNYVDRQVFAILGPTLSARFGWDHESYSYVVIAFQLAYAIGLVVSGRLIDRIGTRLGYAWALLVWSLAAIGHALAGSLAGFGLARFVLGLGEAGNFPAAVKTVAEWFPRRERALATGIFNAGTNVGAVFAPLIVPPITLWLGWRWAFIVTGGLGLTWLAFWLPLYHPPQQHPRITALELAHIESDGDERSTASESWITLIGCRQTWAFVVAKFIPDAVWWFYFYWAPTFFKDQFGVDLRSIGLPLITIYLMADVGSVGGGWLSSWLIHRGWSVNAARKLTMLLCALCVLPVIAAPMTRSLWLAIGLISLAAAAHQGWSANTFTLASDLFPQRAVGSVVGIGGAAGAIGGIILTFTVGRILEATHNDYVPIFAIAGGAYVLSLGIIHVLSPRLAPAVLPGEAIPEHTK